MNLSYKKNNNTQLFASLAKEDLLDAHQAQNYIPIYSRFFTLTDTNFNNINLNNKYSLNDINNKINNNLFNCILIDDNGNKIEKPVFFKFSPLLDPVKYMVGKYDISDNNLLKLPTYNSENSHSKVIDPNNSAYVDGFFTYLTSQLLHNHNFVHSLDFYGSFLSSKHNFIVNVVDDLDYINNSEFFNKNKNNLFKLDNKFYSELINYDTRNYKERLSFREELSENILQLSDISDLSELDNLFSDKNIVKTTEITDKAELLFECDNKHSTHSTTSNCSSRSSNTCSNDDTEDICDDDDNETNSEYSSATDDTILVTITKFPTQIIALEHCEKTLDHLLTSVEYEDYNMSDKELASIIVQILMILITYQKTFGLTHNDLHTNNIMYISTEKEYLYYRVNDKHYKVPTFGRIFKIIDFGRAIYKYKGNLMCSDSFELNGDASSQYNCEPYFNKNKPRLEPNFSFDLCRLGCSMFDYYIDDIANIKKITSPIKKIIIEWCNDDKMRNIMYKNNGEERYPDFKLYKMIARTVHNHIPINVLQNPYFDTFIVHKKKINNPSQIMNIDTLPCYM